MRKMLLVLAVGSAAFAAGPAARAMPALGISSAPATAAPAVQDAQYRYGRHYRRRYYRHHRRFYR